MWPIYEHYIHFTFYQVKLWAKQFHPPCTSFLARTKATLIESLVHSSVLLIYLASTLICNYSHVAAVTAATVTSQVQSPPTQLPPSWILILNTLIAIHHNSEDNVLTDGCVDCSCGQEKRMVSLPDGPQHKGADVCLAGPIKALLQLPGIMGTKCGDWSQLNVPLLL